jgi:hypothetical protein
MASPRWGLVADVDEIYSMKLCILIFIQSRMNLPSVCVYINIHAQRRICLEYGKRTAQNMSGVLYIPTDLVCGVYTISHWLLT